MVKIMFMARYDTQTRGVLVLFPTRLDAGDFSRSRIAPLIDENPKSIGQMVEDLDRQHLKKIGNLFCYFRGTGTRIGLKSIPADFLIVDELDEITNQMALDMARERLSHSENPRILLISNPSLPDFGIDAEFQRTDQRYWLLKCALCGEHTCMEDTFPECLREVKDGRVIRACVKCGAELNTARGEWVAKKPGVKDRRGYHFTQLYSSYVDPGEILRLYRTTNNLQDFYNLKLGLPYVSAENRLSKEEVLSLCGSYGIASSHKGPCYMGVDQGNELHAVIIAPHEGKDGAIVHLGVYRDWEEVERLVDKFKVRVGVIDAMPETRPAREIAEKHKGKVFLCYYSNQKRPAPVWDRRKMTVMVDRTNSLDTSHAAIQEGRIVLPRETEVVRTFAFHCHNTAKKLVEDEEKGTKRYVYVKLGEDHFRHAFNYAVMGLEKIQKQGGGIISGARLIYQGYGQPCPD